MVEHQTAGKVADEIVDTKSNLKKDLVMASADLKKDVTKIGQDLLSLTKQGAGKIALTGSNMMNNTITLVKNPQFQTVTVSTASGAVAIGTAGGAFGCVTGVVVELVQDSSLHCSLSACPFPLAVSSVVVWELLLEPCCDPRQGQQLEEALATLCTGIALRYTMVLCMSLPASTKEQFVLKIKQQMQL